MMSRLEQTARRKANAAFTLVEVVVGLGVLGIMMAAFFAALASGFSIVNTARQDLRATQIVEQKTEAIRLCSWFQLSTLPSTFQDYYYTSHNTNTPSITYYGTISVSNCPSSMGIPSGYYNSIDLVTISLIWTNYLGQHSIAHSRSTQTLIAHWGMVNYLAQ